MKRYLMFMLLLANSVFAGPPLMSDSDTQTIRERLKAHTREVRASDDVNSFATGVVKVLMKSADLDNKTILSGLSESDKILFAEADARNSAILPIFAPYAEKMRDALASDPVDALLLATLLSEARDAEQQYKSEQAIKAIEKLSPQGRKIVMAAVDREISTISYRIMDFTGLAADLPDQVISMAQSFVDGVHHRQNKRSVNKPLDQYISINKSWGAIFK